MDILYSMPRPKPLTSHKAVHLKLAPDVVAMLDEKRGGMSRATYIATLIKPSSDVQPEHLKPGAITPTRKDSKKLIGFDPQTGAPIYG